MTDKSASIHSDPICRTAGRPRGFDADEALRAARDLFWRNGFEQTSLDDLIAGMGIGRSSFYACFGSKHETLIRALALYARDSLASFEVAIRSGTRPEAQIRAALMELVDVDGGRRGCFLANCLSEFGALDPQVDRIVQQQLADLGTALRLPLDALRVPEPGRTAQLLLALALGAIALRKAGTPPEALTELLGNGIDTVL